ncbi:ABC transporter permease [Leucobacter weissii]|uniref:ABC transporter permease n=1 Tax=Leucobacter weissii TaxID=1983706 RepID=A0A939MI11_9MICO|nr:ABC transporter permease [Leucobacter weissii]MBO1900961.1 ABC transporter permease [Leucobacter weissii]
MSTSNRVVGIRAGALGSVLQPLALIAALLLLWQVIASIGVIPVRLLPGPVAVLEAAWNSREALLANTWPTLRAAVLGFSLALVAAFLISLLLDFSAALRRAVLPVLIISQTLPIVAIAPLVILWFGFGLLPKVLLVALVTFFPLTISLLQGYRSSDPDAERLVRSIRPGAWSVFRHVRLPSATVSFFSGLRISITYGVVGAIFAEYAGAVSGLGVFMLQSKASFRTDLVLAAVVVSSLLTLLLYAVVLVIERVTVPWVRIEQGRTR